MQLSFAGVILFLAGYSCGLAAPELTGPGEVSRPLGESVSVQCQYRERYQGNSKYWCRGAVWSSCHTAVKTTGSEAEAKGDRVSIRDNHRLRTFTVTMETLTLGDAGIYWCGISKFGFDPGVPVKVTVLPALSTAVMVTTGSLSPAIGTTNTAEHPKSSPFTSAMFLLPMLLLVLLILLSGAMLLARRMMLKRKKAAGAAGPSAAVNEAVASTESDVSYAAVKPKSRKSITTAPTPHSAQAEPSPEGVEYSAVAPGMTDISYATVKYPILDEQAIYINVDRSSRQPPLSSPLEQTEYCAVKKK
nr:CMRF35-like molecule 5 isoform X3 [Chrysemys picta bellii]